MYQNYKIGVFTGNKAANTSAYFTVYYYLYPGFNIDDGFVFHTLMNLALCYECTVAICVFNLLVILMVFQIVGHVKLLLNNFKEFPRPKKFKLVRVPGSDEVLEVETFDDEENVMVHGKLAELIEHHKFIVSFADDVSDVFGPMLAVNYFAHLVSCCLLLLACTRGVSMTSHFIVVPSGTIGHFIVIDA